MTQLPARTRVEHRPVADPQQPRRLLQPRQLKQPRRPGTQLGDNGVLLPRVTTAEVELSGVRIPAGCAVLPAIVSANRDNAEFADAGRLDLTRAQAQHLGFGAGPHHCLRVPRCVRPGQRLLACEPGHIESIEDQAVRALAVVTWHASLSVVSAAGRLRWKARLDDDDAAGARDEE